MTTTLVPLADRVVVPADADRRTWLAARPSGLGGSEIAAILGLNRWCSPFEVWAKKTGLLVETDEAPSQAAFWGNQHEATLARVFSGDPEYGEGVELYRPWKVQGPTYAHPRYQWMRCTPDATYGPSLDRPVGLWSGKTTTVFLDGEWDRDRREMPAAALCQLMWEFAVTDLGEAWISALIGGNKLVNIPVERDDQAVEDLMAEASGWWERHVIGGAPPPPVGTDAEKDFLQGLYTAKPDAVADLDWPEFAKWGRQKIEAERAIKAHERLKLEAEDAIRLMLGPATSGVGSPNDVDTIELVTWKVQNGKTTPDVGAISDAFSVAAMAAHVLVDTKGAGSAEEHENAGHVLLKALADGQAATTMRSPDVRVLRLTKPGRKALGG